MSPFINLVLFTCLAQLIDPKRNFHTTRLLQIGWLVLTTKRKAKRQRQILLCLLLICWIVSGCHRWCILSITWIQQCWQTKCRKHYIRSFKNLRRFFNLIIHFRIWRSKQTELDFSNCKQFSWERDKLFSQTLVGLTIFIYNRYCFDHYPTENVCCTSSPASLLNLKLGFAAKIFPSYFSLATTM